MDDTISRQEAIDAIERNAYRHTYIDQIVDIIKALPPAQPERKKGEWIWKDRPINKNYTVTGITKYGEETTVYVHEEGTERRNYCPVCGKLGDDTFMNFCPNCGADMRTAKQIIHDAIDNTPMAEDVYVGIKEKLHKAVDAVDELSSEGEE